MATLKSSAVKWVLIAVVMAVVCVTVGTFVYINYVRDDAPDRLTVDTTEPPGAVAPLGDITGTWVPTSASQVGYRVKEILFGQSTEAVGRTNKVNGTLTAGTSSISNVDLTVDMTSVTSDQSRRDDQFRGRIMSTSTHPTARFVLTQPIALPRAPDTTPIEVRASGNLTLRGVIKAVTVDLRVVQSGSGVSVNGTIPIEFSDWSIPNPSFGPAETEDNGELELLVVFERQK